MQVCKADEYIYVKANCIPQMKDGIYQLCMAIQCNGYDIIHACMPNQGCSKNKADRVAVVDPGLIEGGTHAKHARKFWDHAP